MADKWWQGRWCVCLLLWWLCLLYCDGYSYRNQTQHLLCQAQCEALFLDQHQHDQTGGEKCNGTRSWETKCNKPNCPGTCSTLENNFHQNRHMLEPVPNVTVTRTGSNSIQLSWQPAVHEPPPNTIYVIEETRQDQRYASISTVALIGWVRNAATYHKDSNQTAVCSQNNYRVMAINQYGSMGFSVPARVPGLQPGVVTNIQYVGRGVYFTKNDDESLSIFMAILEWDPPTGWEHTDIERYEWAPVTRICQDVAHDSMPIFASMKNHTNNVLVEIAEISIGCTFTSQVRAISRCQAVGLWTTFTIDLTNCSAINGYFCQEQCYGEPVYNILTEVVPPGKVSNVSLSVTSVPYESLLQWVSSSYQPPSGLMINLHISWLPPTDMGSSSSIQNYIIRSGRVEISSEYKFLPPEFIETPQVKNVSGNIVELIFQLPTQKIPYNYSVQVIAMAANQVIPPNEIGAYRMYTIRVERNDSITKDGKILLDEGGIVVVFVNSTLPTQIRFESPPGWAQNTSIDRIDRHALQWGPLIGPNELSVENMTIIPSETQLYDDGSELPMYHVPKPISHNG